MSSNRSALERAAPARRLRDRAARPSWLFPGLIAALAATLVLGLGLGAVGLSPAAVLRALFRPATADPTAVTIVWDLRLARMLLAGLIGAGLASAGAGFQGLFHNPLADPFVVGASGGAALGATLAIVFDLPWRGFGFGPVPLAALVGSLSAVALVFAVAESGGRAPRTALLLAGAALSSLLSAAVSLLLLLNEQPLYEVFAWLMGGLSGRSWPQIRATAPLVGLGICGLLLLARPLDALACGDEAAQSLGLPLGRARAAVVAAASLTTAATVANAGIIGFVGLIAPHIARLLTGAGHARLIPASALIGAILLLVADTAARSVAAPLEIPVGIVTALLGGPFFLVLLRRHGREE